MITSDAHKVISYRLAKENLCSTPLDAYSLDTIEQYMLYRKSESDLCRRLSDIELNYVQICSEAEFASESASKNKDCIVSILRNLTDEWRSLGLLRDFRFSLNEEDAMAIRHGYVTSLEAVKSYISKITEDLLIISETAAQVRACSASFTEVYKESKLAIYALTLNRDVESVLDCRSTMLQAHASASECQRTSSILLGNARICTKAVALLNNMMLEVARSMDFVDNDYISDSRLSPLKASSEIDNLAINLERLKIEFL